MAEMKAQKYLQTYYTERADQRGNHARRSSGNAEIRQAEAFQRVTPAGGERAVSDVFAELARARLGDRLRGRRPRAATSTPT